MQTVLAKERQNLFDIAILTNGDIQACFEIAIANGMSITEKLVSGTPLQIPITEFFDEEVVKDLEERNALTATGDSAADFTGIPGGIGFMEIGASFKVS